MIELNKIYNEDCLLGMQRIPDASIDMILTDLPYETTQNEWDKIIPFEPMWEQYNRIIKPNGAIVLWAQPPFNIVLANSNLEMYRYDWIWEKPKATGWLNSKKMPMKAHENILVFYKKLPTYNPQMTTGHKPVNSYTKHTTDGSNYGKTQIGISGGGSTERYPRSILKFSSDTQKSSYHPQQKPVAAYKYFIRTYTNEGEIVLDSSSGAGTLALAAIEENRNFICFEKNKKNYKKSIIRLEKETSQMTLL